MIVAYIAGAILLIAVIAVAFIFNRLVRLRQNVRESWSAIDTELKRRYDLIPNLVETVKGYATHERQTLESVVAARNSAANNNGPIPSQVASESALTGAVKQLFALAEAYPDLKANAQFQQLQKELSETETRISQSRRFYNANVREMNTATMTFPTSLFAQFFGFKSQDYFEIEDPVQREVVAVKI
ncbi:LemA family protein [soil metagenome]